VNSLSYAFQGLTPTQVEPGGSGEMPVYIAGGVKLLDVLDGAEPHCHSIIHPSPRLA
jgi:hypothetical protein